MRSLKLVYASKLLRIQFSTSRMYTMSGSDPSRAITSNSASISALVSSEAPSKRSSFSANGRVG